MAPAVVDERLFEPATIELGDPRRSVGPGAPGAAVPFYLYSGPDFDWRGCTSGDHTIGVHKMFKHGNDAWFAEHVRRHPWRVDDPKQALLFVAPVLVGWSTRHRHCGHPRERATLKTVQQLPRVDRHV